MCLEKVYFFLSEAVGRKQYHWTAKGMVVLMITHTEAQFPRVVLSYEVIIKLWNMLIFHLDKTIGHFERTNNNNNNLLQFRSSYE